MISPTNKSYTANSVYVGMLSCEQEELLLTIPESQYEKYFPLFTSVLLNNIKNYIIESKKNELNINREDLTEDEKELLLNTDESKFYETFPNHTPKFLKDLKKELERKPKDKVKANDIEYDENGDPIYELENLEQDKSRLRDRTRITILNKQVKLLMERNIEMETMLGIREEIRRPYSNNVHKIENVSDDDSDESSKAAIVLQLSDWHWEEEVIMDSDCNNSFNLEIANRRVEQYCNDSLSIINNIKEPYHVKKLVIALQGDFISGGIHDELAETNQLLPMEAIREVQLKIINLIQFYLDNTDFEEIVIVTNSGNHGRTTKQQRIKTELGHSLEHYMYQNIADVFKDNSRLNFVLQKGYHTILDIYGVKVNFHHGHHIKYGGGVGGIYIPVNKKISNWNTSESLRADIHVFGHFHQTINAKNFVVNGSLIGMTEYGASIAPIFEAPSQNLFVIDSKKGKTLFSPIYLD